MKYLDYFLPNYSFILFFISMVTVILIIFSKEIKCYYINASKSIASSDFIFLLVSNHLYKVLERKLLFSL